MKPVYAVLGGCLVFVGIAEFVTALTAGVGGAGLYYAVLAMGAFTLTGVLLLIAIEEKLTK